MRPRVRLHAWAAAAQGDFMRAMLRFRSHSIWSFAPAAFAGAIVLAACGGGTTLPQIPDVDAGIDVATGGHDSSSGSTVDATTDDGSNPSSDDVAVGPAGEASIGDTSATEGGSPPGDDAAVAEASADDSSSSSGAGDGSSSGAGSSSSGSSSGGDDGGG